jgi:hypothetical protein
MLPLTYKNTKFPSIDDKIKQMMTDCDKALAAHKLAQARIAKRRRNKFNHSLLNTRSGWILET